MAAIGILGGTFDPVHCGHLRLALEMLNHLALDSVRLLPAADPQLRAPPVATAAERLDMLNAAVAGFGSLAVDGRELERAGPSYTVDTLGEMRREHPGEPLSFILGLDAFLRLDDWERWRKIPELAHLAVARRTGATLPRCGPVARLLDQRGTALPDDLRRRPAGFVHVAELPIPDVSASHIRGRLARGHRVDGMVPPAVIEVIERQDSYRLCKQSS